jgi:DNA-binding sugar fermentation-stimulating protein
MAEETPLYTLPKLYKAKIINRPSKVCKSPYLADITVYDDQENIIEENVMAHSPALGCCGMISSDSWVQVTKSESTKNKSKYIIHHVIQKDGSIVGVNPMLANHIVRSLLLNNKIAQGNSENQHLADFENISQLESEHTIGESRFDFTFVNSEGARVYLEVKGVPLADVVDVPEKIRKKMDLSSYDMNKKIAIFPDGYRKNKSEPVSERALKHVNHLREIHEKNENIVCALLFLIQRSDVVSFKPSSLDPIYQKAVYEAHDAGVHILPVCVEWRENECYFLKFVPMLPL